jgi:hypothetical protein
VIIGSIERDVALIIISLQKIVKFVMSVALLFKISPIQIIVVKFVMSVALLYIKIMKLVGYAYKANLMFFKSLGSVLR